MACLTCRKRVEFALCEEEKIRKEYNDYSKSRFSVENRLRTLRALLETLISAGSVPCELSEYLHQAKKTYASMGYIFKMLEDSYEMTSTLDCLHKEAEQRLDKARDQENKCEHGVD